MTSSAKQKIGRIDLVVGCMFSGKTSLVLRMLERHTQSRPLAIKHAIDDRYDSLAIVSHNGRRHAAIATTSAADIVRCVAQREAALFETPPECSTQREDQPACESRESFAAKVMAPDRISLGAKPSTLCKSPTMEPESDGRRRMLVVVDEAHFFDEGLFDVLLELSRRPIHLVLTALDFDSWGNPLGLIDRIESISDSVTRLQATCSCGAPANRTQRTSPIQHGQMVGASQDFQPRCRSCWRPPPADS